MKKLFALAFMSLAVIGGTTSTASAWWPCFPLCGGCSSGCCTTIKLRQYNAFTPICCGTLNCDGCCPLNLSCGQLGSGPAIFGAGCAGGNCYAPHGASVYAGDMYPLGQLPPAAILSQPPMPAPAANGMPAAPAATMPVPPGATSFAPRAFPAASVQPVGYRPMYYYGYGYAPYYWNGAR
jgi:hypothetical protein